MSLPNGQPHFNSGPVKCFFVQRFTEECRRRQKTFRAHPDAKQSITMLSGIKFHGTVKSSL
jgi:hypothetical protein